MDKYEAVKHLIEQGKDATLEDGGIFNCTCAAVLACFYGWVR